MPRETATEKSQDQQRRQHLNEEVDMSGRITHWLERAASSLAGATPLTPIDASYGASFWGLTAMDEGRSRSAGRLPLVAAAHLPVF
jgi:hypothetical protein